MKELEEPYKMLEIAFRIAGISSTERAVRLSWVLCQAILEKGGDLTMKEVITLNEQNLSYFTDRESEAELQREGHARKERGTI